LVWAEGIIVFLERVICRLAAGQRVDDDAILDQDDPAEVPAGNLDLTFEIEEIRPEASIALARCGLLNYLIAFACVMCPDALPYPGSQFICTDRGTWNETAYYIGIIQDGNIRIRFAIQHEFLEVFDCGLVRDDLVEGLLSVMVILPWTLYASVRTRKQGTATGQ
jgi:hypothetical protein